jgi:hypothetical protein
LFLDKRNTAAVEVLLLLILTFEKQTKKPMWKNYCLLIFRCTAPSLLEKELEDEVAAANVPCLGEYSKHHLNFGTKARYKVLSQDKPTV